MLFCNRCDKPFYDGEEITIRNLNGTELVYHHSCFISWTDEQREVEKSFGGCFEQDSEKTVEYYSRTFRDSQIADCTPLRSV